MRVQSVLIWVVVAGLLAGLVALSRSGGVRPERAAGPTTWTIPIDPARVGRLARVEDAKTESVAERTGPDAWVLRWTDASGRARTWDADPARVRAALRLLSTAEIIVSEAEHDMEPAATVRAVEQDGRSVEIWFGPRAAGGQTPVVVLVKGTDGLAERRVDGRIGSGVPDAFVRTDWSAWRDPTLFTGTAASTETLAIATRTHAVRLERGRTGWAITEPFQVGADAGEVERAISALRSVQASGFEDNPPDDASAGFDNPIAEVRVESGSEPWSLVVARGVDPTGEQLLGRVTRGDSTATVRLNADAFSGITAVPDAYARRIPLAVGPADIGRVRLLGTDGRVRLDARRQDAEWRVGEAVASPNQRDAIERLVRVMTAEPAAAVAYRERGEAKGELGSVELESREGGAIATVRLQAEQGPAGLHLLMAVEQPGEMELIWTGVSEQAKGVAAWAAALSSGG